MVDVSRVKAPKNAYYENGKWYIPASDRKKRALTVEKTCPGCLGLFVCQTDRQLTCSHKCAGKLSRGPRHGLWRGGVGKDSHGYVSVWIPHDSPYIEMANDKNRVGEHRLVMAQALGRPLLKKETVHHINGVRSDNRLENLELWSGSHPFGQRVEDLVAWAHQILDLYEGNRV